MTNALWLDIAKRELGVTEIEGVRNNSRILEYHSATKLHASADEVPWCAAFVGWCLLQSGVAPSGSAAAASYRKWGVKSELIPGAVVVFGKSDPDAAGTGHVGFVVSGPENGKILVLSGNCNNAVRLKLYPLDRVVACRWPQ